MQASGAVVARVGDTVVMAAVVMSQKPRDGIDYLPLMVDYEEKLYAAGKIKGSRWVKREGRPSDEAILSGRVIDRSLRPMFDESIRNDIQVVVTVLSVDGENDPDIIGLNAAAAAIEISDIPWDGPIGAVRVGKVNGDFVINPSFTAQETESVLDLIVSGTEDHIIMVEAGASEVAEEEILKAIAVAQQEIKKIIAGIKHLTKDSQPQKRELTKFSPSAELADKVKAYKDQLKKAVFILDKKQREEAIVEVRAKAMSDLAGADDPLEADKKAVNYVLDKLTKEIIQEGVLTESKRTDGRKLDEIRPISCEVGLLPRVHGTGLFQRGETQVLTTVTLGGPDDVQLVEDIDTEQERSKDQESGNENTNTGPNKIGQQFEPIHPGLAPLEPP